MKIQQLILVATFAFAAVVSCETVPPSGRHPQIGTFQRSGEIRLDVATSQSSYRIGEQFSFSVTPSEDCYLAAWVRSPGGGERQIFPNGHADGRVFRAGRAAKFPESGGYLYRVTPPTGQETLIVIASSQPIGGRVSPPSEGIWLKGVSVESAERRGEGRIVYEVKR